MKAILRYITQFFFYALAIGLIGWTASLTVSFVSTVLPDQPMAPYLSLVVFDAGMLIWLAVFIWNAEGLPQLAISLVTCILDLIGVGVMSMAELFLGGQGFTVAPENLGTIAVWVISIWTFLNVIAIVAFHLSEPKTWQRIMVKAMEAKIQAQALEQTNNQVEQMGPEVAGRIAGTMTQKVVGGLLEGHAPLRQSHTFAVEQPASPLLADEAPQLYNPARTPCLWHTGANVPCTRYARPGTHTCWQHREHEDEVS